ncbi:MAG: 3-dehydroquinate synthase [Oligoflexia bacterium]|nr:3-dehydroquinate synthase [Oligoflexia bacterium]MBF0366142.1 3-dehydroquinate synthase [Oligoflexia bacterium]
MNFFAEMVSYLQSNYQNYKVAIITNDTILSLYAEPFYRLLKSAKIAAELFSFPPGEQYKNRHTKEMIEDQMFFKAFGKDSVVVAMGGGVVTDIAGYVAATFCRGVPLVMIPTSLLAMVDASIGGKNGVDTPSGKNLIGTIYQPQKIIIDPKFLKSLPVAEFKNGIVEMIKHGAVLDADYFGFMEKNVENILRQDQKVVEQAIQESVRIKTAVVKEDEREKAKRHLLNFGHTYAHAMETLSNYSMGHGEAVAQGMLVESYMGMLLGKFPQSDFERLKKIVADYAIPLYFPNGIDAKKIQACMVYDKKALKNTPRFVLLKTIGEAYDFQGRYCEYIDESIITKAIQWMQDDLCCN